MTTQSSHDVDLPTPAPTPTDGPTMTLLATRGLAGLRIALGVVFLWAFVDKVFGLGYATASERAWINGGSPTKGFLAGVEVGPFQSAFQAIAGTWWANALFMVGLLAIGVALLAGVAMRIAAASAATMLMLMYLAAFPLARMTSAGEPTGSNNPVVDDHLVYAILAVVLAATYAGDTWGLGRTWARLPFVRDHRWAL